jgi:hypothetical protein
MDDNLVNKIDLETNDPPYSYFCSSCHNQEILPVLDYERDCENCGQNYTVNKIPE